MKTSSLKVQVPLRLREDSLSGFPATTPTDTLEGLVIWSLFSGRKLSLLLKPFLGISHAHSLPQHLCIQEIHPIQLSPDSLCLL